MLEVCTVPLTSLPKLAASELRLLWVNDWYDGPVEAVVEHGGERCLMVRHGDGAVDVEGPLHWVLFRLTPEQWAVEERWHALFEEHVGHHWCFHHQEPMPEPSEASDPARFHEAHAKREPRDLVATAALGWVDEMPAR